MTQQYDKQIEEYESLAAQKQKLFNILGYVKFLALALLAGSLYLIYARGFAVAFAALTAALFAVLVVLWIWHARVHEELDRCKAMAEIARMYLARIAGTWTSFLDVGEEFVSRDHPYAADLDMVGKKSLFQLLNVAHTWYGRQRFAADLLGPAYTPAEIVARQAAVGDLAGRTELISAFQYRASKIGSAASVPEMVESLEDRSTVIRSRLLRTLLMWVPAITTALLCASLIWGLRPLYIPVAVLLAAQGVFWVAGLPKTSRYLSAAEEAPYVFRHYAAAMELLGGQDFSSPLMKDIQATLAASDGSAVGAMKKLDAIVSKSHLKGAGIVYFVLNMLLLWDYRCAVQLSEWKGRYGSHCGEWFDRFGELESLLSFTGLVNVCDGTAMPQIAGNGRVLRANSLGHPLLPNDGRVNNDLDMGEYIYIISGSNMSGKTTFLRTVGVNLILARAGSAVCAREMTCSLFHVMSSMRIADDLSEGISTFYAELRRIKEIIDAARKRQDLFFLIDEIFRGTNSEDRLLGANTVLEELSAREVMGVATTHDLALCALADRCPNIRNYSFSERYEGDEMFFDYQIRAGKSKTTNARFLMRKVGILN